MQVLLDVRRELGELDVELVVGRDLFVRSMLGVQVTLVVAIVTSLVTGLRLSADAEGAWFSKLFEPILPQGEIWTWHYLSAVFVLALIFAYAAYMSAARLKRRISSKKVVVLSLPASNKLRIAAVNVIAYWILFGAVLTLTATGVLLYLGHGGLWVTVHYISALTVLGYIVAHVVLHYFYGGLAQLLRLFRPQPLRYFPGMGRHPLLKSLALGAVVIAAAVALDFGTRGDLYVSQASALPKLDGVLDDAALRQDQLKRRRSRTADPFGNLLDSGNIGVQGIVIDVKARASILFR